MAIRKIYKVTMNIILQRKSYRMCKPCIWINENLTGCLQRFVVLGYERIIKDLISNTNNNVLQIIFSEHNCDFHRRTGETWRTRVTCPDQLWASKVCRTNNFPLEESNVWWRKKNYYKYDLGENNA
jgi:hypothetical protein